MEILYKGVFWIGPNGSRKITQIKHWIEHTPYVFDDAHLWMKEGPEQLKCGKTRLGTLDGNYKKSSSDFLKKLKSRFLIMTQTPNTSTV